MQVCTQSCNMVALQMCHLVDSDVYLRSQCGIQQGSIGSKGRTLKKRLCWFGCLTHVGLSLSP